MRARSLIRLYPRAWRQRYGDELADLLATQRLTLPLVVDLLRGAFDAHLHPQLARPALMSVQGSRLTTSMLKQPTALIPLAMSFAALVLVLGHIAFFGVARQPDEGTAAHLWQLLMAGQLPIVAFFAMTTLPRRPARALRVLGLQALAVLAAAAPVFILRW